MKETKITKLKNKKMNIQAKLSKKMQKVGLSSLGQNF